MIQTETKLQVADNSGARLISCIKVIGGSKRRYARIGDIIIVSIKEAIPRSKVKKTNCFFTYQREDVKKCLKEHLVVKLLKNLEIKLSQF